MSNYGKARYYRILDINFIDISSIMLEDNLSLIDYYQTKYSITIKSLKQPLLVAESKDPEKPTYLVPELMLMTGIPDNFDEMRRKKISENTIKPPDDKVREINKLMNQVKQQDKIREFDQLGLTLNYELEKIDSKLIPTPAL